MGRKLATASVTMWLPRGPSCFLFVASGDVEGLGDADRLVTTALALSSMLLLFLVLLSSGTAVASDAAENPEASETVRS